MTIFKCFAYQLTNGRIVERANEKLPFDQLRHAGNQTEVWKDCINQLDREEMEVNQVF